ncbi:MCE family protein [Mycobacterium shigaense]|uniref:Mammalian cell entry protein n=1 Tax=Mycobacterium shigaense TaxID=722731 RepID=A0A1Z4EN26_9MYCO|nr:MCE family protein [Mycobacterium shigaense]MEA1120560.1 MCE family protein [Mycobacterium shigaense]PRI14215.1 mammalian cell entry protein [Mycobacterium shigaense]BAX94365.1 mammalian cell entry protein [Mycobacterium shigaense]
MTGSRGMIIKFGTFGLVMTLLTVSLFFIFGQYTTGSTTGYSALFNDVSRLKEGQTVRVAGVRVGTVKSISLRPDKKVLVKFDADRSVVLTTGTRAMIRYLNLVGDRYLELVDGPGSTKVLPAGSEIPLERTAPALDLDLLLGGLKPVTQGLNPHDVNELSAALIQVFQGEGGTLNSLFAKTTSFSNAIADNGQTVQELIDNLNIVVGTVDKESGKFSDAIDRLEKLISGLSNDRDTIGTAITSLDNGTASLASLLSRARKPLANTVDQLDRMAPLLAKDPDLIDISLQKLPHNYKKLQRLGSYGAWFPYYLCGLELWVSDLQYRTVQVGIAHQTTGRCAEPKDPDE